MAVPALFVFDEGDRIVDHRATLNDAMDQMLESSHAAVSVTRRGKFIGNVYFDSVTALLRQSQENAAAATEEEGRS